MQLSYKYAAYPDREVEKKLFHSLDLCRWLYNTLLGILNDHRGEFGKQDTQDAITQIKQIYPELNDVHSKVLQMVNYTLWSNIKSLVGLKRNGRRIGRLKYKRNGQYNTLVYNQSGFAIDGNILSLSKVGKIPFDMHRPLSKGDIKGVVITRQNGKWYVAMQVEVEETAVLPVMEDKVVGLDVGVTSFVKDFDGEEYHEVENPKYLAQKLDELRFRQQELSRKQKGSNNRRKARKQVAKVHEKVKNVRNNRNHQVSRKYVDQYSTIVVEDLDILGMVNKQHRMAMLSRKARRTLRRNILDAGWGDFVQKLSYKAQRAGKLLLKICPTNTTQRCSSCGELVYKDISQRTHECPYCGMVIDRDDNAAMNIRNEGIIIIRAGNLPEPEKNRTELDGEVCLYSVEQPGKHTPMKQETTAFRP